ncbi:MAG: hypothetical protein JEZ07_04730 [Phycisphaerae bacterium]|nr:hypothetical protein [Phycisphaerae bacterium]
MSKTLLITGIIFSAIFHFWVIFEQKIENIQPKSTVGKATEKLEILNVDIKSMEEPTPEPLPQPEPTPEHVEQPIIPEKPKPQVKQEKMPEAEPMPKSDTKIKGDFAGDKDGLQIPMLRINWGTSSDAYQALCTEKMMLVVLENNKQITSIIEIVNNKPTVNTRFSSDILNNYSPKLRVVDNVPAFEAIKDDIPLKANQHLAVMMSNELVRSIENAKITAARRAGLAMNQIKVIGADLKVIDGNIQFNISQIQERI